MADEESELCRGDAVLDQEIASLRDRFRGDIDGYYDIVRRLNNALGTGDLRLIERLSEADVEWILRLAHFGAGMLAAKLLGRDV
jgi:hypothetical protein